MPVLLLEQRRRKGALGLLLALMAIHLHRARSLSAPPRPAYDANMKTKIASSVAKTERREVERSRGGREVCDGCSRPPPLCVCESLPEQLIDTSTSVLVLQHPRERRRKSLSTVPLMPLVLKKCEVKTGYNFKPEQLDLVEKCLDRGQKPLLLFPGPDAISLDSEDRSSPRDHTVEHFRTTEQLLILIDGTWAEAKRMIMQSPHLIEICQQVQFQSDSESIYPDELRKEPESHCLSTLESCACALMLLEPSSERATEAKDKLEGSMRCMVEKRMSVSQERNRVPRFERRETKIFEKNKRRHQIKQQLFS